MTFGLSIGIYPITAVALFNYTAFRGSKVLLTLFALKLGASPLLAGAIYGLYSIFPIFLAVYAGKLADRIGMRLPLVLGMSGIAAGLAVPWLVPNLFGLVASAALVGMSYIFFHVSMQSAVGFVPGDRTRNQSMLSLASAAAQFLGPLAVGLSIDARGHTLTYLVVGLLPLIPLISIALKPSIVPEGRRRPEKSTQEGGTLTMLRENPGLRGVLVASVTTEAASELYAFYMPLYGHTLGLSASVIGTIMGIYALGMVLIRLLSPLVVRKLGEEHTLRFAILVVSCVYCAFPFAGNLVLLGMFSLLLGLALGCCVPLTVVLIHARAPEGRAGEAIGVRQTLNKITDLCTPLLFGSLGTLAGAIPIFWGCSALLLAGSTTVRVAESELSDVATTADNT